MGKDRDYGKSGRLEFISRIGAAIALAAGLASCTSIVSQKPIFARSDFDQSDGILGLYGALNSSPPQDFVLERGDAGQLRLIGLISPPNKGWMQSSYADVAAIPLGGGDYVFQISCSLMRNDKGWEPVPVALTKGFSGYALALKDRRAGSYWVTANFSDTDPNLLTRYGAVDPSVHDPKQDSSIRILPASMSKKVAIAFFRDAAADFMNNANGNPGMLERGGPDALHSDEAKAIVLRSSQQCRSLTQSYRPPKK